MRRVSDYGPETTRFLADIVRTPSLSGEESQVAGLIADKMREHGYDSVHIDQVGNAIGIIRGQRKGKNLLLNGHMDHVPPAGMKDPYSARTIDGNAYGINGSVMYGRGTCDMKGALSAMVMAGAAVRECDIPLEGDICIAGVIMEEVGGSVGSKHILSSKEFVPDLVLIGEATNLQLALGHRGCSSIQIVTRGRSCHASAPDRGINALYGASTIIQLLRELAPRLPSHTVLGKTTISPTNLVVESGTLHVVPSQCTLYVDARCIPDFTVEQLIKELQTRLEEIRKNDPEFNAEVSLFVNEVRSSDGTTSRYEEDYSPFYTDPHASAIADQLRVSVRQVTGRDPEFTTWTFATDGAFFSDAGIPVFGFGPGEERFAHTTYEVVSMLDVHMAAKVYASMIGNLSQEDSSKIY